MNEFEEELLRTLHRVEPPVGFAGSVLARIQSGRIVESGASELVLANRSKGMQSSSWPSFLLLAASLAVACGSALEAHHQQQIRQAQQVASQFNLAITLTAKTLHHINENVSRAGVVSGRQP